MLKIDILTIFPNIFDSVFSYSIIERGSKKGLYKIEIHDLRKWSKDVKHKRIDDKPYGGGPGMIFMIQPIYDAINDLKTKDTRIILLSAKGKRYNQKKAAEYSKLNHLILICGHYEGIDQRVIDNLIDDEISIGEYVLTGGEIPAMTIIDSVVRLIPGVLGNNESLNDESFSENISEELEYPQYTRPSEFKGMKVPDELLSGNHELIKKWRREQRKNH